MIMNYRSIENPDMKMMTVVPDGRTWFLKGFSPDDRELALDLMVDDEYVDTILVASGSEYDALFANCEFPEDLPEDKENDDEAVGAFYVAWLKYTKKRSDIFNAIYKETIREMKNRDAVNLDFIITVCVAHLINKNANQKP